MSSPLGDSTITSPHHKTKKGWRQTTRTGVWVWWYYGGTAVWWCSPSFFLFPSFCLFVSSFSVCFLYRLLRFSFRFPAFLGGGFCCSVVSSWRYTPPRAPCEPEVCVFPLRAVFFLALLILTYSSIFILFLAFFDFDLDMVCFILSFSCEYYAVSSVSISAATRLAYDVYLDTYVRWYHLFIFVWGIRLVSVIVCIIFVLLLFLLSSFFICFPLEVIFRSRVIGACPVTTDCVVRTDELMWEQQQWWWGDGRQHQ